MYYIYFSEILNYLNLLYALDINVVSNENSAI